MTAFAAHDQRPQPTGGRPLTWWKRFFDTWFYGGGQFRPKPLSAPIDAKVAPLDPEDWIVVGESSTKCFVARGGPKPIVIEVQARDAAELRALVDDANRGRARASVTDGTGVILGRAMTSEEFKELRAAYSGYLRDPVPGSS